VTGRAAIQQTVYRLGGSKRDGTKAQVLIKPPKTEGSRRSIPLAPELVTELLAHRDEQQARRRKLGDRWHDHDLVFCQRNGKPLVMHNVVRRDFHEVLTRAKVQQVRFHDLRHSAASLLLARGVHPKVVQELLGHQSPMMTMSVYSHTVPTMGVDAVNGLASTLLATR
jgi:integrase